ncbi:MAG: GNAT family N-acetyltransferase, partial [Nanoarchaeota archaeon]
VRELHVYGESAELGKRGKVQHRGYGKLLMKKAEEICRKNKKKKLLVISGIGAKAYYKKLGYKKDGYYMSKTFF